VAEDSVDDENVESNLHSAGQLLRRAREQKGLSLEDISKQTRIPNRHLASIESGDFDALPGRTYAIGFAKSYARAVGLSDASIGSQLRTEMDEQGHGAYQAESSGYAPANPSSVPPVNLTWAAGIIGILVLVGYLVWRSMILNPAEIDPLAETETASPVEAASAPSDPQSLQDGPAAPSTTGTVVLTATEPVWMKIYDAEGERLFENEMAAGDTFTVPTDADNPQILTGRPDALTVTIDGQVVPPLGTGERTIKDMGVSAQALLSREKTKNPETDQTQD